MIGDRRRKERASSTTLIFFERERFCVNYQRIWGSFVFFFGGVSNVEVQKKNNRSPKQRPPALPVVSEICKSNSSFTSRDTSLSSPSSTSSNGRDELHVLHGVAEQQRSLEDDLVWDGDAVVSEIFERFNHRYVFLFFFPRGWEREPAPYVIIELRISDPFSLSLSLFIPSSPPSSPSSSFLCWRELTHALFFHHNRHSKSQRQSKGFYEQVFARHSRRSGLVGHSNEIDCHWKGDVFTFFRI